MATEITKPSFFDSLGLSSDKKKSLERLQELAKNDEFTVNKLGEVTKWLQTLDQSDRKSISGLDSKDLDKIFDYRAKRIITLSQYEPGTIIGGKYYPGKEAEVKETRAKVKSGLQARLRPIQEVNNRNVFEDVGARVKGVVKGSIADQRAADYIRQGKKPDPAYYIPDYDAAQQGGASFGYGMSQGLAPAISGIPAQSVSSGAFGLLGRGVNKLIGNSAPVNIALAAGNFAVGAYGAQKGGELFSQYQDPFRGLPKEQVESAQLKGIRAFSGPDKTLGSIASSLAVFKPGYIEGAGLRQTARGITRDFTGATRNPAMMGTATDVYDRAGSMLSTDKEIDVENAKIEKSFFQQNGRPGTRAELIGIGWKNQQAKLAQMATDALLGDHTLLGRAASGEGLFSNGGTPSLPKNPFASQQNKPQQGSTSTSPISPVTPGVRPIRVLTTLTNANGSPIPHAIRYDSSTGGAEIRPHAAIPTIIIKKVNEGVRALGTINGTSITGVSDTGDIFVTRVDASGKTVIESKSFNELPPEWQSRVDSVFLGAKDTNQKFLRATALPQAEYNPAIDADAAYKSAYKTPIEIDGVTVNAAVISDPKLPLITVKLPSGAQLTLPRTSFADPDTLVQQSANATVETTVSKIKTAGANKFDVGVTSNGADFLIPDAQRAIHAANPAHFRNLFSAPSRPAAIDEFKRGTVVSLGNFNGRDQVGVVLDYKEFDIDGAGTKGYGFQVKSVTDPTLRPFYVSGTTISKASPAVTAAVTGGASPVAAPAPVVSPPTVVGGASPVVSAPTTIGGASPIVGMPGGVGDPAALSTIPSPPSSVDPDLLTGYDPADPSRSFADPARLGGGVDTETSPVDPHISVDPSTLPSVPTFGGSSRDPAASTFGGTGEVSPESTSLTSASGIPDDPYKVAKETAELIRNSTLDEWNALDKAQQSSLIRGVLNSPDACNEIATDMLSGKSPAETTAWLPVADKESGGETYIYNTSGQTPSNEALAFIEAAKESFGKIFKPVHEDYNDFGKVFLEMYQDDIIFMTGRSALDADGLVTGISPSITSTNARNFYYTRGNKADSIQLGTTFVEKPYDNTTNTGLTSTSADFAFPRPSPTNTAVQGTTSTTSSLTPALDAAVAGMNAPSSTEIAKPTSELSTDVPNDSVVTDPVNDSKPLSEVVDTEPSTTDIDRLRVHLYKAIDVVTSQPSTSSRQIADEVGITLSEARSVIQYYHDLGIIGNGDGNEFPVEVTRSEALSLLDDHPINQYSGEPAGTSQPVTKNTSGGQVQLVDDEGYAIQGSGDVVPPENYPFPYDKYDVIPPTGVLPAEMERGREGISRYRKITPQSEEGRVEPVAVTLKKLPAWARGETGFTKIVSNIRVKLFDRRTNVTTDWNATVSGVSNKEELIAVLKKEWGQTDEQARVLGEWVDRFSIGWSKEFARLHGIRTLDRYRALRLPGVDPQGFPKGSFDQWKTKYREQQVVSATKENAEVIMRLQKAFYTNRLGAIAALTGDQSKAIGRTGMTFSIQGDSKRILNVIAAVHGPGNFNTHVHEINHALVRSMYAPMIHEMASRVYETYKQRYSKDKQRQIMSALEEQIVTEMTNRLFNFADTPDQNLFGSEYFEGGFDATLNKLAMDMSNAMRSSVPLSDDPRNNLFNIKHWSVGAYDKDTDYAKGTPIVFKKDGEREQGKFVSALENGVKVAVGDKEINISSGEIEFIGALDVKDLSSGAKSYMSKMFGHWYEYTGQVIDKLAPALDVSTETFTDITIAEVRRYTSGYKWWQTKDLAMGESPYTGLDTYGQKFTANRVSERMSQSYLGWLDRGGYDAYVTGHSIDIEGLVTDPVLELPSRVVNGQVIGFNADAFKQASEMILGTAPDADPDDIFGSIDTSIKPMNMPSPDDLITESNTEDIRAVNAKEENTAKESDLTKTFDNSVVSDVVDALKAKMNASLATDNERLKSKVVDNLLKQGFVSWVTNRKVLPKYRWVTGFEYARMGFVGREFGGTSGAFKRKSFDEMFNYVIQRSSGPSEIVTTVYTEVRNDLLKLMGNLHPMIDPATNKVIEGQYAHTVVDSNGFHTTTVINSAQLVSRFHNAVSAGAERAVKMVADEIHPPTGEMRTHESDAKGVIESDPVLMSIYKVENTNKLDEGIANVMDSIIAHEAWVSSGNQRTYITLTQLFNKLVRETGTINESVASLIRANRGSITEEEFVNFKNNLAWNAEGRKIREFALVGTKKSAFDTLRLIDGKIHVADLNTPIVEGNESKILERVEKQASVERITSVVKLDDVFNSSEFNGSGDWESRIGTDETNVDLIADVADNRDALDAYKASLARQMVGMFDSSAFVKQIGVSDPSFDRDAYYAAKRVNAAYNAALQRDKADGKKTSSTVLKHAEDAARKLSEIESQIEEGLPETKKQIDVIAKRLSALKKGKGDEASSKRYVQVNLDTYNVMRLIAIGDLSSLKKMSNTEAYKIIDEATASGDMGGLKSYTTLGIPDRTLRALASAYDYVENANRNLQDNFAITPVYAEAQLELTPIEMVVAERRRINFQSRGIKPIFAEGKSSSVTQAMTTRQLRITTRLGEDKLNNAQAEVVRKFDQIEKGLLVTSIGKLPRIKQANVNAVITAVDSLIADARVSEDKAVQTYFTPKNGNMYTANEWRIHVLTEMFEAGEKDVKVKELITRLEKIVSNPNTDEIMDDSVISDTVNALFKSTVTPPSNIWTMRTVRNSITGEKPVVIDNGTFREKAASILTNARDEQISISHDDFKTYDQSVGTGRSLKTMYKAFVDRFGDQTVLSDDQLRILANLHNDSLTPIEKASLFIELQKQRNAYVKTPLESWLKDHSAGLGQMTVSDLNKYLVENDVSKADSFAIMQNIVSMMSNSRSPLRDFTVAMGRLPTRAELPMIATQIVDRSKGKLDIEKVTADVMNSYDKVHEEVASLGLQYLTNAVNATRIQQTAQNEFTASSGMYGLFLNAPPDSMDIDNGRMRHSLLDQSRMFGTILGEKAATSLRDDAISEISNKNTVAESIIKETELLNASRVRDVIFETFAGKASKLVPAPGSKQSKSSNKGESPESQFVEYVKKQATSGLMQMFDAISAGDGFDPSIAGMTGKQISSIIRSPSQFSDPSNLPLVSEMKRFTEALAKDMIKARYELVKALNDPMLNNNQYIQDPNNATRVFVYDRITNRPTHLIDYATADVYPYDPATKSFSSSKEFAGGTRQLTEGQRELFAGIVRLSPSLTADAKKRVQQAVLMSSSLETVPAVYWHGKSRIENKSTFFTSPDPKANVIEPMFMNDVLDDIVQIDSKVGTRDPQTIDQYVKPVVMKWVQPDKDGFQRVQLGQDGLPAWDGYGYTVQTPTGSRSHIYANLVANGLTRDKALEIYALTEHPEFAAWKAGDLVDSVHLNDAGSFASQGRKIAPETAQKVRGILQSEQLKRSIDEYMDNRTQETYDMVKFHYDELFGAHLSDEELSAKIDAITSDDVQLMAVSALADQYAAPFMTPETGYWVNPVKSHAEGQTKVTTGRAFTTMAFDFPNQTILSYQAPGFRSHDLGSGLHKNNNRKGFPRFIRMENPLVFDAGETGLSEEQIKNAFTKAMKEKRDGVVFTNYSDSMLDPNRKNIAFTFDDSNIKFVHDMHRPIEGKSIVATQKTITPMFMNDVLDAPVTKTEAPALLLGDLEESKRSTLDYVRNGAEYALDELQAITRAPLSLDLAFTAIQGGKYLLGAFRGRPMDTYNALKALIYSFPGLAPNLQIEIFGKKIGFAKLGRRMYMKAYQNMQKDPDWQLLKDLKAPLHMLNLERRFEGERDRIYRESNGAIPYEDIDINLMDYDERGNLPDFFQRNTLMSQLPLQGMFERQISLQHDMLMFYVIKHQIHTNPILRDAPPETLSQRKDAQALVNFVALTLGDFQYSTDERRDAIAGRVGKFVAVAPRWFLANVFANSLFNAGISNSKYLRKVMGNDNRVFDVYSQDVRQQNPELVRYMNNTTWGTMGCIAGFQLAWELLGFLTGREDINSTKDKIGSIRSGNWKWADSSGSWDMLNTLDANWNQLIGGDPGVDQRGQVEGSGREKVVEGILNRIGYKAAPIITGPLKALYGRDVLNRNVWETDSGLDQAYQEQLQPLLKATGFNPPDRLPLARMWWSNVPSSWQEYTESYGAARKVGQSKEIAAQIALTQFATAALGTRAKYSPFVPSKNMKLERFRATVNKKANPPTTLGVLMENMKYNKEENLPWYKRSFMTGTNRQ
jgi:hypothetical protein